jgi:hypothetical protein
LYSVLSSSSCSRTFWFYTIGPDTGQKNGKTSRSNQSTIQMISETEFCAIMKQEIDPPLELVEIL